MAESELPCHGGGKRRNDVATIFQAGRFLPQAARPVGVLERFVARARHAEGEDTCDSPHIDCSAARDPVRHSLIVAREAPGSHDCQRTTEAVADEENVLGGPRERRDQSRPNTRNAVREAAVNAIRPSTNIEIRDPIGRYDRVSASECDNERRLALGNESLRTALTEPCHAFETPSLQNALQFALRTRFGSCPRWFRRRLVTST